MIFLHYHKNGLILLKPEEFNNKENYMMNILLIGDVHGKFDAYCDIIKNHNGISIQLGDFGFDEEHQQFLNTIDYSKNKVLFGNHDYYPMLYSPHSLGDFGMYNNIFYVRGAYSIDKMWRKESIDWFENEELTYTECNKALDLYCKHKPKIVISHDCPTFLRELLFDIPFNERTITSELLDQMFEFHKPEKWYFGHHHQSIMKIINNCEFRCLNELESVLI